MTTSQREAIFHGSSAIIRYLTGDPRVRDVVESSTRLAINSIVVSEVSFNILRILHNRRYGRYRFYDMKSGASQLDSDIPERTTIGLPQSKDH